MGDLTTVVFRNDQFAYPLRSPAEIMELIQRQAASGRETRELNGIKLFKPRNSADWDRTVYVLSGNTVVEMRPHTPETERILREHPKFYEELVQYL